MADDTSGLDVQQTIDDLATRAEGARDNVASAGADLRVNVSDALTSLSRTLQALAELTASLAEQVASGGETSSG